MENSSTNNHEIIKASLRIENGVNVLLETMAELAEKHPSIVTVEVITVWYNALAAVADGFEVYASALGLTREDQPPSQRTTDDEGQPDSQDQT